jgi:hypothetical protein
LQNFLRAGIAFLTNARDSLQAKPATVINLIKYYLNIHNSRVGCDKSKGKPESGRQNKPLWLLDFVRVVKRSELLFTNLLDLS